MRSAEWVCTNCSTVNRICVKPGATTVRDRCITCHRRHVIVPGVRRLRWEATAAA